MGSALWVSTQEEMRMRGGGRLGRRVLGRAIKGLKYLARGLRLGN